MKRPLIVTLVHWLVLIFTAWNLLRTWTSLAWKSTLEEYSVSLSPAANSLIGAFWTVTGLVLVWGIWQKKPWSTKWLIGLAAGYTVWYWSERLIWQNPHPNVTFVIIINIVLLTIVYFASKTLSREAYERNIENPKIE